MPPQARRTRQVGPKRESPGLQVILDGQTYTVRESDLTPRDVSALRRETGLSWMGLGKALRNDPDIDLLAALVWLARRLKGEPMLTYDAVLDSMGYGSDIDIRVEGATEDNPAGQVEGDLEGDLPEA